MKKNVAVEIGLSPPTTSPSPRYWVMPRAKGAPALPKSKGSITSFFNGTSKALRRVVECPVCSVKVEEGQINKHMDGPECKLGGSEINVIEVEDEDKDKRKFPTAPQTDTAEVLEAEKEQNTNVGKLVKTQGPILKLAVGKRPCEQEQGLKKSNKRQKKLSEEVSSHDTERSIAHPVAAKQEVLQQKVKDDSIISDLLEDEEWVDEEALPSSQQKILLSPSISYNPARYILIIDDHIRSLARQHSSKTPHDDENWSV